MSVFYDLDRANDKLPELRQTLLSLRAQRASLIELRDRVIALHEPHLGSARPADDGGETIALEEETQRLQLRMQGLVDQMQAAVAEIDGWGVVLRDIESGLVDFPALVAGRQVWLCWRLDEEAIGWWHELSTGIAGRRRLEDLF